MEHLEGKWSEGLLEDKQRSRLCAGKYYEVLTTDDGELCISTKQGRGRPTESEMREQQESVSSGARKRREDISDSVARVKGSGGWKTLSEASRCAW